MGDKLMFITHNYLLKNATIQNLKIYLCHCEERSQPRGSKRIPHHLTTILKTLCWQSVDDFLLKSIYISPS